MKIRNYIERMSFQTPLSISLLLAFFGVYFGALLSQIWLTILCVCTGLALIIVSQFSYFSLHKSIRAHDQVCLWLVIIALGLTALSLSCFSIRNIIAEGLSATTITVLCIAVLTWIATLFEVRFMLKTKKPFLSFADELKIPTDFLGFLPLIILLTVVAILSIGIFDSWFRWDSYDYFYYFEGLNYGSLGSLSNLRPANHAAYACSLLFLIVDGIVGEADISLILINVLMLLLGSFAFWRVLIICFPNWNKTAHALGASMFAFSPFLLGLEWSVNLETYMIFGLVIYIWAENDKLPLLQIAASLLICFSKETGAIILAAMILARIILNLCTKAENEISFVKKLELSKSVPILFIGLLWLVDFVRNSWISTNNSNIATDGPTVDFNCISINSVYIKDRLISLLFSNFTWLLIVIIAVGAIVCILRKDCKSTQAQKYLLTETIVGVLASLVPLFFFVTYNHIRYAGPTVILLLFITAIFLDKLFAKAHTKIIACAVLGALFLGQSFTTLDPMMYAFHDHLDKGYGTLAVTENHLLINNSKEKTISVSAQYNREIMYFDEALDDLLDKIDYDDRTLVVLSNSMKEPSVGAFVYTEYLITGFGYPYMEKPMYMSWDPQKGTRYLSENESDKMHIKYFSSYDNLSAAINEYDRCFYLSLPFLSSEENEFIMQGFNSEMVAENNVGGWRLAAYRLTI